MKNVTPHIKIILFDGICNLCNNYVNFIIKRDKRNQFRFATLQSDIGKDLITKYQIDISKTDSIILIKNEKAYIKSTAALNIARDLKGAYPLFYGCMIIPKFIRNRVYDIVAKNRYTWFGKKDSTPSHLFPTHHQICR